MSNKYKYIATWVPVSQSDLTRALIRQDDKYYYMRIINIVGDEHFDLRCPVAKDPVDRANWESVGKAIPKTGISVETETVTPEVTPETVEEV